MSFDLRADRVKRNRVQIIDQYDCVRVAHQDYDQLQRLALQQHILERDMSHVLLQTRRGRRNDHRRSDDDTDTRPFACRLRAQHFGVDDAIVHRDPATRSAVSRLMQPHGHTPERVTAKSSFRTIRIEHPHPGIRIAAIRRQHDDKAIASNRSMSIADLLSHGCEIESSGLRRGPCHRVHKHVVIAATVHLDEGKKVHAESLLRDTIQLIPASQKELPADCNRRCIERAFQCICPNDVQRFVVRQYRRRAVATDKVQMPIGGQR